MRADPFHCRDKTGVGVGIGIGIEKNNLVFGHEKLDVYSAAIRYTGCVLASTLIAKPGQRGYAVHKETVD